MQKRTLEILKNYSTIVNSITINEGQTLRTQSADGCIYSVAVVPDTFPRDFSIYSLPELLSTISLFDEPDFNYTDDAILIKNNTGLARYVYCNPKLVRDVPKNSPKEQVVSYRFTLEKSVLDKILKASAVMRIPNLLINKEGVKVLNIEDSNSNSLKMEIETFTVVNTELDRDEENHIVDIDSLKIIPDSYLVDVTQRYLKLTSVTNDLQYYISLSE